MERIAVFKNDKDVLAIMTLSKKELRRLAIKLFHITKEQWEDVKDPQKTDRDRFICDEIKNLTLKDIKKLSEKNVLALV